MRAKKPESERSGYVKIKRERKIWQKKMLEIKKKYIKSWDSCERKGRKMRPKRTGKCEQGENKKEIEMWNEKIRKSVKNKINVGKKRNKKKRWKWTNEK